MWKTWKGFKTFSMHCYYTRVNVLSHILPLMIPICTANQSVHLNMRSTLNISYGVDTKYLVAHNISQKHSIFKPQTEGQTKMHDLLILGQNPALIRSESLFYS